MRVTWLMITIAAIAACDEQKSPETTTNTTPPPVKEWEGCAELKSRLDGVDVKFSSADYSGEIATWRVNLFGVNFAVPHGEWDLMPSIDQNGGLSAVLVERESKDTIVWTLEPVNRDAPRAEPPTMVHRKLVLGYEHTKSDLTCAEAAKETEAPIAEALVLKSIPGSGKTIAVHHELHNLNDIARFSSLDGQWQWEVWFPTPRGYAQATYRLADEAGARALAGARAAAPGAANVPGEQPAWIALFEAATAEGAAPEAWKALLAERQKSGGSEQSIAALKRLAEPAAQ